MTNASLNTIYTVLSSVDFENKETVLAEVYKDLHRNDEVKAKKAQSYDALHDIIVGALDETPVTLAELYESIANKLPFNGTGMHGKVQYALTHLWQDEIKKIPGKPNTYCRA